MAQIAPVDEENGYNCAVCNDTEESTSFTRFTQKCEHMAHTECVARCIENRVNKCPMCREPITAKDIVRISREVGTQVVPQEIPMPISPLPVPYQESDTPPPSPQPRRLRISCQCNENDIKANLGCALITMLLTSMFILWLVWYIEAVGQKTVYNKTWVTANCTYIRVELVDVFYLNFTLEIASYTNTSSKFTSNGLINCDATDGCADIYTGKLRSYTCYYNRFTMKDGVIPLSFSPKPESVKSMETYMIGTIVFGILTVISCVVHTISIIGFYCSTF